MSRFSASVWRVIWMSAIVASGLSVPAAVRADHWHHVHVSGSVFGPGYYVHPSCVTNWYGYPPLTVGFGGGIVSPWGGYSSGYSSFGYSSWGLAPVIGPTVVMQSMVVPTEMIVVSQPQPVIVRSRRRVLPPPPQDEPNMQDILQQHAERREGIPAEVDVASTVRPVSGSSRAGKDRSRQFQAEGDHWLHEGQFVKAYLRYLEAQREAEDRGDVYFRQAFALVALGRYSHAVMKLKRGLQVDPNWPKSRITLDAVYGVENVVQKTEYLQRVADWANANVRDADRLFLMGVMLFCDEDDRANEFFRGAVKLTSGQDAHVRAFLKSSERVQPAHDPTLELRRALPPPPPPEEAPAPGVEVRKPVRDVRPMPPQEALGPRLPERDLAVPPEPAPRLLILPDLLDEADAEKK